MHSLRGEFHAGIRSNRDCEQMLALLNDKLLCGVKLLRLRCSKRHRILHFLQFRVRIGNKLLAGHVKLQLHMFTEQRPEGVSQKRD